MDDCDIDFGHHRCPGPRFRRPRRQLCAAHRPRCRRPLRRSADARVSAAKAKHVTVAVPCLPSPTARPKRCHRSARRDAPDHRKVARKPFYFDYLVAMLSTWIALHEFPANRELFAAPSVISSRSYRRSLSGRHIFPFSDHHSRHISASEFCRGSPRWIQGF
jgi:hypothetical protein